MVCLWRMPWRSASVQTLRKIEKGVRFVANLGKMGIIPSYEADRIVSQMDEISNQEG